MNLTPGLIYS
jgi:hypothetical protein